MRKNHNATIRYHNAILQTMVQNAHLLSWVHCDRELLTTKDMSE